MVTPDKLDEWRAQERLAARLAARAMYERGKPGWSELLERTRDLAGRVASAKTQRDLAEIRRELDESARLLELVVEYAVTDGSVLSDDRKREWGTLEWERYGR